MLYFNIMKFGLLLFFIHARGNFTFGGLFRVLCKYFAHGACLKGEYCEFSHDWTAPPSNVNITSTPLCYQLL